ncbi:primosomal replication protein [Enterovibrio sp. ZSDZ35]|uniref:Primosomal replication protein n=1 Tax=Enterovibrio qingdaonensis TaxID=2899818 RepID=A0ABT5QNF0_9GAMM|nr:primosomal replication protein [Enterovibrio sp. ZSDZ35]MDD1782404.1 primosomal replication protein [Enterovibrio sp. ZSDZ35]
MDLTQLKAELQSLATKAADIDRRRGEGAKPLFDERLFSCLSRLLSPCVAEAKGVVDTLEREKESGRLSNLRAAHLCDKLINQLSALQREVATVSVRAKEKTFVPKTRSSISQLYQDLAQHQDWERRLSDMVRDAESKLGRCETLAEQQAAQKHLLTTEKRLSRCREAKKNIESRIAFREKKG